MKCDSSQDYYNAPRIIPTMASLLTRNWTHYVSKPNGDLQQTKRWERKKYLIMKTNNASSNPPKQREHDLLELYHVNRLQNLLYLPQKHHLLLAIRHRLVLQQPP